MSVAKSMMRCRPSQMVLTLGSPSQCAPGCRVSITQMMSSHSIWSALSGQSASSAGQAEFVSKPNPMENACSAVGLRNPLPMQTKLTRGIAKIASKV